MAQHLRRTPAAVRVGRAVTVPVVLAGALAVGAPAFAAKPGASGSTGGTGASCSVTPNPVAVNADYTLTVVGLGSGTIVNEVVTDASGNAKVWQLQANSSGSTSVVGHTYWAGQSNVTIQKQVRHGWSTMATCSFMVG